MKILSITAQKPNSTGSGVYLTELVKEYAAWGYEGAVHGFAANKELLRHYVDVFHAEYLGMLQAGRAYTGRS